MGKREEQRGKQNGIGFLQSDNLALNAIEEKQTEGIASDHDNGPDDDGKIDMQLEHQPVVQGRERIKHGCQQRMPVELVKDAPLGERDVGIVVVARYWHMPVEHTVESAAPGMREGVEVVLHHQPVERDKNQHAHQQQLPFVFLYLKHPSSAVRIKETAHRATCSRGRGRWLESAAICLAERRRSPHFPLFSLLFPLSSAKTPWQWESRTPSGPS